MTDLMRQGMSRTRITSLSAISRSMLYYVQKERTLGYDKELKEKVSDIVKARPSYGTRWVTAMIRRSGMTAGRKMIRRYMRHMNLVIIGRKHLRELVLRLLVVQG